MSIFLNEAARKLRSEKYNFEIVNGAITVVLSGGEIVNIGEDGGVYCSSVFTDNGRTEYFVLSRLLFAIHECCADYENAVPLDEKNDGYRAVLEHNGVVLAIMYDEKYGFSFATFLRGDNGGVLSGNPYDNYDEARDNFAIRAALIDGDRYFDLGELTQLKFCVDLALENSTELDGTFRENLNNLKDKIAESVPERNDISEIAL